MIGLQSPRNGRRPPPPIPRVSMPTAIRTPRLLLRSLRDDDRHEFVRVHEVSEEFFRAWSPVHGGSPEDLFDAEMAKVREGEATGRHHRMVGVMEDGRIAGFFNLGEVVRGFFHSAYAGWRVNVEVASGTSVTRGMPLPATAHPLLDLPPGGGQLPMVRSDPAKAP